MSCVDVMQCRLVVIYWCFGTTCWSHLPFDVTALSCSTYLSSLIGLTCLVCFSSLDFLLFPLFFFFWLLYVSIFLFDLFLSFTYTFLHLAVAEFPSEHPLSNLTFFHTFHFLHTPLIILAIIMLYKNQSPPTSFRYKQCSYVFLVFFLDCLTLEDGTNSLSRNIGTWLPIYIAWYPRRAKISFTMWRKTQITVVRICLWTGCRFWTWFCVFSAVFYC